MRVLCLVGAAVAIVGSAVSDGARSIAWLSVMVGWLVLGKLYAMENRP